MFLNNQQKNNNNFKFRAIKIENARFLESLEKCLGMY